MERRSKRVSLSQWDIALDFLERNQSLVRGYNNSSRARELSQRLWRELAALLNAEGSGATKSPKDWATYFNNFKSKLKKMVSDLNAEATATGGGPPQAESLSDIEQRYLSIMGSGFGQGAPNVRVNPFPNLRAASSVNIQTPAVSEAEVQQEVEIEEYQLNLLQEEGLDLPAGTRSPLPSTSGIQQASVSDPPLPSQVATAADPDVPPLPRRTRRTRRYHTRPMAPIDEARRILSQVEMQRATADAEIARALYLIGENMGRIADIAERYFAMHQNNTL